MVSFVRELLGRKTTWFFVAFCLCLWMYTANATQFQDSTRSPNAAFTEKVPLITETDEGMVASTVTVPTLSNFMAYVCFALKGKRPVQCLYMNKASHEVVQQGVILDGEKA